MCRSVLDVRKSILRRRLSRLRLGFAVLGLVDACYLSLEYLFPLGPSVCVGNGEGCDIVRNSRYAFVDGVPLSLFGILLYASLLLLLWLARSKRSASYGVLLLSGAGSAASLYLVEVQGVTLHAWCVWCVTSAVAVALIFLFSVLDATWRQKAPI